MSNFKKVLALLLALLMLLPLASCGNETKETEKESESESETSVTDLPGTEKDRSYLNAYGDSDAAEKWLKANIENTDVPPVSFKIGSKKAADLKWKKEVGEPVTVTDYEKSDDPVKRTYREIKYTCEEKQIELVLTLTTYPDYPVVEMASRLTNLSDKNSERINDLCAYGEVDNAEEKYTVHYNYGSHYTAEEYRPFTQEIGGNQTFQISNGDGMPSSTYIPYINIEGEKGGVIAAINWQGDWEVKCNIKDGKLRLSAGQNKTGFVMLGNESFKNTGLVLLFYKNGDWQYGQNVWRRWVIEHNLMRNSGRRDYTQNVFLCSGIQNTDDDMEAVGIFARSGVTKKYNCTFEIDAGWYICGGDFTAWTNTGNWDADPERFPSDKLAKLSKACADAGAGFCLWMEPERFMTGSPEYNTLGEGNYIDIGWGSCLINYGTQKSQDYAVDLVDGVIKKYGLTVYRQDFNTTNRPFWDANDAAESEKYGVARTGATQNHACEGYINAWTRIAELNPGLIFDSCAGGGRRNDIETVRFSFAHTKSDYWGDVNSQQCQNLASLSWLIFTGTGFLNEADMYDVRSRLTLSIGVGAKVTDNTLKALSEWDSLQKYMYNDYYALSEYSLDSMANIAMQFHDHENNEGMLIAYLRNGGKYNIVAKALSADKNYKVWLKDDPANYRIMSGKEMMSTGVLVAGDSGKQYAIPVFYEETNEAVKDFNEEAYLSAFEIINININTSEVERNDEAKLVSLWKDAKIGNKAPVFLTNDFDSSGGIYGVSEKFYKRLPLTDQKTVDDWTWLDASKLFFDLGEDGKYPLDLEQWSIGMRFDMRVYAKEIDGCYFIWFDNSYGFGDTDGSWKTHDIVMAIGDDYASDPFTFVVAEAGAAKPTRDIQFACYDKDGSGSIYRISDELLKKLPMTDEKYSDGTIEWTKVNDFSMFWRSPSSDQYRNDDNDSLYTIQLASALRESGVNFYVGEKDGAKYFYIQNSVKLGVSGKRQLYWSFEDKLYRTEIYVAADGYFFESIAPLENLINLY